MNTYDTPIDFSIDTSTLVDKVENRIIELLLDKKLKVGDAMPKELELAETLRVSRTVIREALMRLKVMGIVTSKKKKGTVITSPDLTSVLEKSMKPEILNPLTLKEMFEMRLSLEIGMADFIIQRVTADDIKDLKNIVKLEKKYQISGHTNSEKSMVFNAEYEALFHGKLYEITNNNTLKNFQNLLLPIFSYVIQRLPKKIEENVNFTSHAELITLIEKSDAHALRDGIRQHLDSHFKHTFTI